MQCLRGRRGHRIPLRPSKIKLFPAGRSAYERPYRGKAAPCDLLLSARQALERFAEWERSCAHEKHVRTNGSHGSFASAPSQRASWRFSFRPAIDHDLPPRLCRLLPWCKSRICADVPAAPGVGPLAPEFYFAGRAVCSRHPASGGLCSSPPSRHIARHNGKATCRPR